MYRKQYKNSRPFSSGENFKQHDSQDANPKNKLKSNQEDVKYSNHSKEDLDNHRHHHPTPTRTRTRHSIHVTLNNNSNNLERESERGESITRGEIRTSGSDPYFQALYEGRNDDKKLNAPTHRYHHHHRHPSLKKRRSVDHYQQTIGEQSFQKETAKAVEQRYSAEERNDIINNRNYRRTSPIRRTSSLNSIPSDFYPDPYSVVFSRYLEDSLGSLSPYSSATGSEATEYLPLSSRTVSPLSSPEKAYVFERRGEEERKEKSGLILSAGSSSPSGGGGEFEDKMNFDSALSTSEEYQSFRSSVPLRKYCVEADGSKEWKVYDAGPRGVRTPLLCIGPACATADVFFRQILNLTARGFRVISVEGPVYWSVEDWCKGLKKLLDCLNLDKVHIFGASLGGFLAQKFAEYTYHYSRVASLMLCNTFLDTSIFDYHDSAMIFWMLPSVILKKLIIENITAARIMDLDIAHAIEFMIERLNHLSQQELASRMTLNCVNSHVDTFKLKQIKMTIMDVFDESALSHQAREDLYRNYTDAKLAHLKSGGNFPYLSRSDEVNMHIMVHLRAFNETKHTAQFQEIPAQIQPESSRSTHPIPTSQRNGSGTSSKTPDDVFGSTDPTNSYPASSVEERRNQAYKEEAAAALRLPVQ